MRTKQAKQNAASTYRERHTECRELLDRIAKRVENHAREQAGDSCSWGYAGDLAHVNEQLAYVLAFLGDRSAVDAQGLVY